MLNKPITFTAAKKSSFASILGQNQDSLFGVKFAQLENKRITKIC